MNITPKFPIADVHHDRDMSVLSALIYRAPMMLLKILPMVVDYTKGKIISRCQKVAKSNELNQQSETCDFCLLCRG
jgi:hypothetical protein